jgi:hypothetical protein
MMMTCLIGDAVLIASTDLSGSAAYVEFENPTAASTATEEPTQSRRRNRAREP